MFAVCLVLFCTLLHSSSASGDVVTHSVNKRQAGISSQPTLPCTSRQENEVYQPPDNPELKWICSGGTWISYRVIPTTSTSCKEVKAEKSREGAYSARTGVYWINKMDPCMKDPPKIIKIYCDMTLDGGGWTMVWKHSPMDTSVLPLNNSMKYYSTFSKPCTDLEAGWCNVPNKKAFNPTEMMIVVYHNKAVVYAYKGDFNLNIDKDWYGAILYNPLKVVDSCSSNNGVPPDPYIVNGLEGLAFDKHSPGAHENNCDTYQNSLSSPRDCRYENCGIHRHSQMTMVIYVR